MFVSVDLIGEKNQVILELCILEDDIIFMKDERCRVRNNAKLVLYRFLFIVKGIWSESNIILKYFLSFVKTNAII